MGCDHGGSCASAGGINPIEDPIEIVRIAANNIVKVFFVVWFIFGFSFFYCTWLMCKLLLFLKLYNMVLVGDATTTQKQFNSKKLKKQ